MAGFLHRCESRRRAAAGNMPENPDGPTRLDRGEHRHTLRGGGTPPPNHKINQTVYTDNLTGSCADQRRRGC